MPQRLTILLWNSVYPHEQRDLVLPVPLCACQILNEEIKRSLPISKFCSNKAAKCGTLRRHMEVEKFIQINFFVLHDPVDLELWPSNSNGHFWRMSWTSPPGIPEVSLPNSCMDVRLKWPWPLVTEMSSRGCRSTEALKVELTAHSSSIRDTCISMRLVKWMVSCLIRHWLVCKVKEGECSCTHQPLLSGWWVVSGWAVFLVTAWDLSVPVDAKMMWCCPAQAWSPQLPPPGPAVWQQYHSPVQSDSPSAASFV